MLKLRKFYMVNGIQKNISARKKLSYFVNIWKSSLYHVCNHLTSSSFHLEKEIGSLWPTSKTYLWFFIPWWVIFTPISNSIYFCLCFPGFLKTCKNINFVKSDPSYFKRCTACDLNLDGIIIWGHSWMVPVQGR